MGIELSGRNRVIVRWLGQRARSNDLILILAAIGVGAVAASGTIAIGAIARTLQHLFFDFGSASRLSQLSSVSGAALLLLPAGGAALALFSYVTRSKQRALVDTVEANALHGGRLSLPDSLVISGQTAISNGFGASVGLEAAYAQCGGIAGSLAAKVLRLRRSDYRDLVGAGAGAAIAAAFGAPLAGAFYAFEIVIGAYTPSAMATVAAATLTGSLVSFGLGVQPYVLQTSTTGILESHHYIIYAVLGAVCALLGILLMRSATAVDQLSRRLTIPDWSRPIVGGFLLIPIAMYSPQVLSAGHGALHANLSIGVPLAFIATILLAKALASIVSLGFGFRGGLFFASLFLGSLIGHLFASLINLAVGHLVLDPLNASLVGMAAFAVSVVGGPMTMSLLVLEATHNFSLTGAVIASSIVASTLVRETFGYSFSTWRLHLRGHAIRSVRDIGWASRLTAREMMRKDARPTPANTSIEAFRQAFPLGSTTRVVLTDADGRYAGVVPTAAAFAEGVNGAAALSSVAILKDAALSPDMDIASVMRRFDAAQADELAVLDTDRRVIGVLSENFARRRYAEELEKTQREMFGEG